MSADVPFHDLGRIDKKQERVIQLGVPQRVVVSPNASASAPSFFASPKSAILMVGVSSSSNNMFSGLISRCTHPRPCYPYY